MIDRFLLVCVWIGNKLDGFFKRLFKEDYGNPNYFPYDDKDYLNSRYMKDFERAVAEYNSKPSDIPGPNPYTNDGTKTGFDPDGSERIITEQEDAAFYDLIDPKGCRIEIYQDRKKEWRWRFFSANNKIIATSGEGYKRKGSLRKSLNIVREVIPFVPVEEV